MIARGLSCPKVSDAEMSKLQRVNGMDIFRIRFSFAIAVAFSFLPILPGLEIEDLQETCDPPRHGVHGHNRLLPSRTVGESGPFQLGQADRGGLAGLDDRFHPE